MKNFIIDMAAKSENLNSNSKLRLYKQNMMLKFMEINSNEPRLTQKQNFNHLGYSDSTSKRFRDDNQMDSPNKRNKYRKTNNKPNTTISQPQSHTTNDIAKNNKNAKSKKMNDIKGGFVENNH